MKKHVKKVLSLFLALTLIFSVTTVTQAKVSVPTRVFTLYSKSSKLYDYPSSSYRPANQPMFAMVYTGQKLSNLKSSNPSVLKISSKKGIGLNKKYTGIYLDLKKTGTSTISYKSGNITTTAKIVVKKYVPPFSSIKLGKLNVTSKLKTNNTYNLSYSKYKNKNLKLSYKVPKDWTINAFYKASSNGLSTRIANNKSFKVTKKNSVLSITAYNNKTRQTEECFIFFK